MPRRQWRPVVVATPVSQAKPLRSSKSKCPSVAVCVLQYSAEKYLFSLSLHYSANQLRQFDVVVLCFTLLNSQCNYCVDVVVWCYTYMQGLGIFLGLGRWMRTSTRQWSATSSSVTTPPSSTTPILSSVSTTSTTTGLYVSLPHYKSLLLCDTKASQDLAVANLFVSHSPTHSHFLSTRIINPTMNIRLQTNKWLAYFLLRG